MIVPKRIIHHPPPPPSTPPLTLPPPSPPPPTFQDDPTHSFNCQQTFEQRITFASHSMQRITCLQYAERITLTCACQYAEDNVCFRVGQFCPFLEFHQKSWVCGSPRYNMGNYQIFLILVQKPVRATPLKVHNFKKIQGAKNKK